MDFSRNVVSPESRQNTTKRIASYLQKLNPDRNDFQYFFNLAQKFEQNCYSNASSYDDYQQRIKRRLKKAQRAQQESSASANLMSSHGQTQFPVANQPTDMAGSTPNHTFNSVSSRQNLNGNFQDMQAPHLRSSERYGSQSLSMPNQRYNGTQPLMNTNPTSVGPQQNIGMAHKSDVAATGRFSQRTSCTDSGFRGSKNFNNLQSNGGNIGRPMSGSSNTKADMPFSEIPEPIPFNNSTPDGIPDPIPISNGQPEICGYEKRHTGGYAARNVRTQPSQSNSMGVDPEAYNRRLRVLEMRNQHSVALESFRRKSCHFLKRMKERSGQGMARQLEKLKQYILYATNTLNYMEKCENGHFPSEQTVAGLKVTINKILGANKMIEGAISKSKNTQQVSKQASFPNWQASNSASQPQQFQQQHPANSFNESQVDKSNNHQYHNYSQQNEQNQQEYLVHQSSSDFDFAFNQQSNMSSSNLSPISQTPQGNHTGVNTTNLGTDGHANQAWQSNRPSLSQQNSQQQPIINVTVNVSNIQPGSGNESDPSKAPQQVNISYQPNSNVGNVTNNTNIRKPVDLARSQSLENMDFGSTQSSYSLKLPAENNDEFDPIKTFLQFDQADEKFPTMESQPSFDLGRSTAKTDPQLAKNLNFGSGKLKNESAGHSFGQQHSITQPKTFQPNRSRDGSIYQEQNQSQNSTDLDKNGKTGWRGITHTTGTEASLPANLRQGQNPVKVKSEHPQEIKVSNPSSIRTVLDGAMQINARNVNTNAREGKQPHKMFFERNDARFSHSHLEPPLKKFKIPFTNPASGALQASEKFDGSRYKNDATQLAYFLSQHFAPVTFRANPSGNSIFFDCDRIITVHIIFEQIKQLEESGPKIGQPLSVSVVRKGEDKAMPSNFAVDSLMKKMFSEQQQFAFSKHSYFKKITAHAIQMLMFFVSKHSNVDAIILFCKWIYSYCKKHGFEQGHAVMHSLHFDYESQSVLPPYLRSVEGILFSPEELF